MEAFDFAFPSAKNVALLKGGANEQVRSGLVYLLDICRTLDANEKDLALGMLERNAIGNWRLFAVQAALLEGIENDNEQLIRLSYKTLVRALADSHSSIEVVDASNAEAGDFGFYELVLSTDMNSTYHSGPEFRVLESDARSREAISKSLVTLELEAPELSGECREIMSAVFLIQSQRYRAGCSFSTLGAMFVSRLEDGQHWTRYLEHYVHESAHSLMYLLMARYELFSEVAESKSYYSPYRSDARPLSGSFHAFFVIWRTIYMFDRMISAGVVAPADVSTGYNQAGNLGSFTERFWTTQRELVNDPSLSSLGVRLVEQCSQAVAELERKGRAL